MFLKHAYISELQHLISPMCSQDRLTETVHIPLNLAAARECVGNATIHANNRV